MKRRTIAIAMAAGTLTAAAYATNYNELISWDVINSPPPANSAQHYGWVIDGTTSYHQLGVSEGSRIVKVTDIDGAQNATELVSQAAWNAATGETTMLGMYGFGMSGDSLQFSETITDGVWRVDKATGALSAYVTEADIIAVTGLTSASLKTSTKTTPTGEQVFYESKADDIMITLGEHSVATLISSADLTTLQGNDNVSGGMGYDATGALYWGNSTNDAIYMRADDGTLGMALSQADIIAVTGKTAAGFRDIEMGGDGLMYFYETSSDSILRFDAADPAASLAIYLSEADLMGGPAGDDSVYEFGWYNGGLAFNINGDHGLYVVPAPSGVALLGLAGLATLRRRRR